jgi:hypothetical protein
MMITTCMSPQEFERIPNPTEAEIDAKFMEPGSRFRYRIAPAWVLHEVLPPPPFAPDWLTRWHERSYIVVVDDETLAAARDPGHHEFGFERDEFDRRYLEDEREHQRRFVPRFLGFSPR